MRAGERGGGGRWAAYHPGNRRSHPGQRLGLFLAEAVCGGLFIITDKRPEREVGCVGEERGGEEAGGEGGEGGGELILRGGEVARAVREVCISTLIEGSLCSSRARQGDKTGRQEKRRGRV